MAVPVCRGAWLVAGLVLHGIKTFCCRVGCLMCLVLKLFAGVPGTYLCCGCTSLLRHESVLPHATIRLARLWQAACLVVIALSCNCAHIHSEKQPLNFNP